MGGDTAKPCQTGRGKEVNLYVDEASETKELKVCARLNPVSIESVTKNSAKEVCNQIKPDSASRFHFDAKTQWKDLPRF